MDLELGGVAGKVTIIMMCGMRKKIILNKSGGGEWYNPEMIHYAWSFLPTEFHIVILSTVASFSRRAVPGATVPRETMREWWWSRPLCSTALSPGLAPRAFPPNPSHHSPSGQTASKVPPPGSTQNAFPMGIRITLEVGQENTELSSDFCVKSSRNMEPQI